METPLAAPMVIKARADSEASTACESRRSTWETLPEEPAFVGAWQPSALDAPIHVELSGKLPPPPGLGSARCRSYSDALMGSKPERQRSESNVSTSEGSETVSETVSDSGETTTEEPLFIGEQPWQSEQPPPSAEPVHVAVPPPPPPPPGLAEQWGALVGGSEADVSVGSMGHPHKCGQPCKYMRRKGGCRNGADCLDCHICQWQRDRKEMEEQRRENWSVGTQGHPYACKNPCRYVRRKGGCRNGAFCESCHLCMWRRGQDDEEEPYLPEGFAMQQGFVEFVPMQAYHDGCRGRLGRVQQPIQFCPWWQGNC